uniref:F-box domain-containing protein n=1 Tax=Brassica oleracea var. oleracea TaxID=109376 RepID=A0A0D3C3N1_BRAOL
MKPQRQNVLEGGLTISRRVTRSMTRLHQNTLLLPDDLILEIFSRLPSKSIARCRCLSKLWASTLRGQGFTELFLTRSRARPQLLFAFQDDSEVVFFSSPQPQNPEENSWVVATNHLARFPSYHGIYSCSTYGFFCYKAEKEQKRPVSVCVPAICNPNTGQSLTLPILISKKRYGVQSYLGYEPMEKELKLLSMNSSRDGESISVERQVLTLGTKNLSWRLVECCVPHYFSLKWICISGVLYYAASVNDSSPYSMVACFDLSSEKFSFVKFVETFSKSMEYSTKMAVVVERMLIDGLVGTNEIVLSPSITKGPAYVIYYNVERKTITKVEIQGMEAYQVINGEHVGFETAAQVSKGTLHQEFEAVPMEIETLIGLVHVRKENSKLYSVVFSTQVGLRIVINAVEDEGSNIGINCKHLDDMKKNGLARKRTTLSDPSLEYLPTNARDGPIICYGPPCKPLGSKPKPRLVK